MTESANVVTVNAHNFQSIVLEGSFDCPVLVDFWADWCAPCRSLMPMLAKLADEYGGRFLLAKVNTEEEQALAAHFGIRSLPTVQLFKAGELVDQFMGALPETQVRDFLDRHIARLSDDLLTQARSLTDSGDFDGARALIERARLEDPSNTRIRLAELEVTAARGDVSAALEAIDKLPLELINDPQVSSLRGRLRFASIVQNSPDETSVCAKLEADPQDSESKHRLAAFRVLRGDAEGALDLLLDLMKHDRAYGEDAGRRGMLAVFDLLGGHGDLVSRYRARMMNALY